MSNKPRNLCQRTFLQERHRPPRVSRGALLAQIDSCDEPGAARARSSATSGSRRTGGHLHHDSPARPPRKTVVMALFVLVVLLTSTFYLLPSNFYLPIASAAGDSGHVGSGRAT